MLQKMGKKKNSTAMDFCKECEVPYLALDCVDP